MLIEFTVGNFRSIKEQVTLSMVAANLVSQDKIIDKDNVIGVDDDLRLLKSAAVYGANASGKTNLAIALQFMRSFVLNSSRDTQIEDEIPVERFRLSTETENKPSFFQMVFLLGGKKYRYGFEVTSEMVMAEWLFDVPTLREAKLFERKLDAIKVSPRFKEGLGIEERTRENALFLSVAAQFNGNISGRIITWFRQFMVNLGVQDDMELQMATQRFHKMKDREAVLRFVRDLDLGIDDIHSEEEKITVSPFSLVLKDVFERGGIAIPNTSPTTTIIKTIHRKYDTKGNVVGPEVFDLDEHESAGTRRLFSLALPILDALETGRVLFIDEIDARIHPLITSTIIGLFNSKKSNPKNAQLIFTTHDTSLLSKERFRRDQIWFVEKDRFGATHLYSLVEFRVRNDASFERDYIRGKYGAIPFIRGDLLEVEGGVNAEK